MRNLFASLCALGALLVLPVVATSCSSKENPKGELMLSIQSDMTVPKDVDLVRIEVTRHGVEVFGRDYPVGPDGVHLPSTLAIVAGKEVAPITARVIARKGGKDGKVRVLREAITTVPTDRIALLRMPIEWLCDGMAEEPEPGKVESTCPDGQTCIAGACKDQRVDSTSLPPYAAGSVYGGGTGSGDGTCLDTLACFSKGFVVPVDLASCSVAKPASAGEGINVALMGPPDGDGICGPQACLIPLDGESAEGWQESGGRLVLPKAVCDKLAAKTLTAVAVTTACPTKTEAIPPCGPWSSVSGSGSSLDAGAPQGMDAAPDAADAADAVEEDVLTDPTSCTDGESDCVGNTPRLCEAGVWAPGVACGAEYPTCSEGKCICNVGTKQCLGGLIPGVCNANGTYDVQQECGGNTPVCSAGECICSEGATVCELDTPATCTGGTLVPGTPCSGDTPSCNGGLCVCPEGNTVCQGNDQWACTGGVWGLAQTCSGATPLCVSGQCICQDGYQDCLSPTEQRICVGGAWTSATCGGSTPACELGQCVECINGTGMCLGGSAMTCTTNIWEMTQECGGSTPICLNGQCLECTDGYKSCSGATPRICVAGAWTPAGADCSGATPVCDMGACRAPINHTIAVGPTISCGVLGSSGVASCWGTSGSLLQLSPTQLPGASSVVEVAASMANVYMRTSTGEIWDQMLGGSVPMPVSVNGTPVELAAGMKHACIRMADGTVQCWGYNNYGQLGDGSGQVQGAPVPLSGLTEVVQLALGGDHSCARTSGGEVYCWGRNVWYQVGIDSGGYDVVYPAKVAGVEQALSISAGLMGTCALLAGSKVMCWGYYGGWVSSLPTEVTGATTVEQIALGANQLCTRNTDTGVTCKGTNIAGELGNGTVKDSTVFVPATGVTGAVELAMGALNVDTQGGAEVGRACARLSSGDITCWGDNTYGQMGNLDMVQPTPVQLTTPGTPSTLVAGGASTCAVNSDNTVSCWGANRDSVLADPNVSDKPTPALVASLTNVVEVSMSRDNPLMSRACARKQDGTIACWGGTFATTPTTVAGLSGTLGVAVGTSHVCVIASDNTVQCWGGANSYGEMGDGTNTPHATPAPVLNLTNVVQIAAGPQHTCARRSDNTVWCWGYGQRGELGNGGTQPANAPVQAQGLTTATQISCGWQHCCAVLMSGQALCWGDNTAGQVGPNLPSVVTAPSTVQQLNGAQFVAAGILHTCAITPSGAVCWGFDTFGSTSTLSPQMPLQTVVGLQAPAALAVGGFGSGMFGMGHSCAIASGQVWCWGADYYGQLGDGKLGYRATPSPISGINLN